MKKEYSYNQLANLKNVIQNLLNSKTDDGKKRQFHKKVVFKFRKNVLKIDEAIEILKEDDVFQKKNEKYDEYVNKLFETGEEHGAEFKQRNDGLFFMTNQDVVDMDAYLADKKKLDEEYKDIIEMQNEIVSEINKFSRQKNAEVELEEIPFDLFPEKLTGDQLPMELIDLISYEEDSE